MKVYFVRHGKTLWNLEMKIQGWEDSPLVEGDDSPEKAAKNLQGIKFDYICSSDLQRAITTKKRILDILGLKDEGFIHPEFREVGFGILEGKDISFVKTKYTELWRKFKVYNEEFDPGEYFEGFESAKKVRNRVISKLQELKEIYGENSKILVISHGSTISLMQTRHIKELKEPAIVPGNGEVVIIDF